MERTKARQLAEIIVKIRLRKASDKERSILNDWLDECEANRQTYKRIIRGEAIARRLKTEEQINATANFRKIQENITRALSRQRHLRQWRRLSWGAAAAVLIGIAVYTIHPWKTGEKFVPYSVPTTVIAAIPNSEMKTMLVTADGKQIDLEQQFPDTLASRQALIHGEKGRLSYNAKTSTTDTAIQEEWNKVITSVGGEYVLTLSDGTRVWMNANTTLEFPVNFVKSQRRVKLQGEAYFEVARDESKPFIVETTGMQTKVLGTTFNIKAYPDESREQTTLLEGKVEVSLSSTSATVPSPKLVLEPGMQAQWEEGSTSLSMQAVNPDNIIAWRRGEFVFNEEDINIVLRTLSRWYGVEFISSDIGQETYTFSGMMSKDDKLETTLEILTLAGGPAFKIEGNKVYMSKNKSRL
ncbi:FecR family protein [Butyricimonas virosa]|uniref:FecR family protein n=2 Tax=Butyricimonas virosa TaxID=544645 RepID=A0A415Q8X6_9BACT|nr:FecR family protein [Butyricimonas virosa]